MAAPSTIVVDEHLKEDGFDAIKKAEERLSCSNEEEDEGNCSLIIDEEEETEEQRRRGGAKQLNVTVRKPKFAISDL